MSEVLILTIRKLKHPWSWTLWIKHIHLPVLEMILYWYCTYISNSPRSNLRYEQFMILAVNLVYISGIAYILFYFFFNLFVVIFILAPLFIYALFVFAYICNCCTTISLRINKFLSYLKFYQCSSSTSTYATVTVGFFFICDTHPHSLEMSFF